jgi:hypothetical protein
MEFLLVLRVIWRRRRLLALGVLAALAVFIGLGGTKPADTTGAAAWTRVTLDTHTSQLVAAAPAGAPTLAWRASLIAHLMATQATTQQLAARVGVKSDEVSVVDPSLATPLVPTDMASAGAKGAREIFTPYVLNAFLADPTVPVITIDTAAPTVAFAERLAQAAVAVLQSQASPGGRLESQVVTDAGVLGLQRFVVDQVGPVQSKLIVTTSLPLKAIGGSFFVFFMWCFVVLLLPRLRRAIRVRIRALPA